MLGLAARLGEALQGFSQELRAVRRRQLHFATTPLPSLEETSWLPRLLHQWRSPRKIVTLQNTNGAGACGFTSGACQHKLWHVYVVAISVGVVSVTECISHCLSRRLNESEDASDT